MPSAGQSRTRTCRSAALIITDYYRGDDPLKRKVAPALLESFLFYLGFYLPIYSSSKAKPTKMADLIRLIIRDEGVVHGYTAASSKRASKKRPRNAARISSRLHPLLARVVEQYENEVHHTQDLYDPTASPKT